MDGIPWYYYSKRGYSRDGAHWRFYSMYMPSVVVVVVVVVVTWTHKRKTTPRAAWSKFWVGSPYHNSP